jgi:8-hydroxy-5-deazaflavin:NADPH oxidoreductase
MKITIIGAVNMGLSIGTRAIAGGHEAEILDRDPAEGRALADQPGGSASVLDPSGAFGGVVVFGVYYPGIKEAVEQYADRLGGKVVVDITNPVDTCTSPSSSRSASASRARSSSIRDTPPRSRDGAAMSMEQALPRSEPDIRPLFRSEDVIDAGSAL